MVVCQTIESCDLARACPRGQSYAELYHVYSGNTRIRISKFQDHLANRLSVQHATKLLQPLLLAIVKPTPSTSQRVKDGHRQPCLTSSCPCNARTVLDTSTASRKDAEGPRVSLALSPLCLCDGKQRRLFRLRSHTLQEVCQEEWQP